MASKRATLAYWPTCSSKRLLTAWIPFHDIDEERGTLVVLDGSHLWAGTADARFFNERDLDEIERRLATAGRRILRVPLRLQRGQVSFHHSWTLHASYPNRTSEPRLALAVHLQDLDNHYQESRGPGGDALHMFDERLCRRRPSGEPGPPEDGFVDDCVERLLATLRANRVGSAFVRMHPLLNEDLPDHLRRHALTANGTTVSIDLTQSGQRLWATMSRGHANAVNKARRAGCQVQIGPLSERFDDFCSVYQDSLERLGAFRDEHDREHLRRLAGMAEAHVAVATLGDQVAGAYVLRAPGHRADAPRRAADGIHAAFAVAPPHPCHLRLGQGAG